MFKKIQVNANLMNVEFNRGLIAVVFETSFDWKCFQPTTFLNHNTRMKKRK